MSVLPVGFGSSSTTAYQIANSIRLDGVDDYLSRTFGTPTLNTKFYLSCKLKRAKLGVAQTIISSYNGDANNFASIYFDATDHLVMSSSYGGTLGANFTTNAVFRDPTAWLHLEFLWDGSLSGNAKTEVWLNGVKQTSSSSNGSATVWHGNTAVANRIGLFPSGANQADCYLAEIYAIDGQSLTLPLCGELDSNNVWVPKAYTGSYGNNGFHLDFSDGTSTTTLGYDAAGSNDWTLSGMTRAAGVNECWMVDTPTDNFATLNPLSRTSADNQTYSNGNLTSTAGGATVYFNAASISLTSGKWYWEYTSATQAAYAYGLSKTQSLASNGNIANAQNYTMVPTGQVYPAGSAGSTYTSWTTGATVAIAYDADTGYMWYGIASGGTTTWMNSGAPASGTGYVMTTAANTEGYTPISATSANGGITYANFGQRDWVGAAPTGFLPLSTANLPAVAIPDPSLHFDVDLYTANGTGRNRTGFSFQPDFAWFKARSAARNHVLFDSVRGVTKALSSNLTNADTTDTDASWLTAFNADGYSLGPNTTTTYAVNYSTDTMAAWLWKAGGTGVSNTDGSITSTVSANTTAGFSIVTFTMPGSNIASTVGHGLGSSPKFITTFSRSVGSSHTTYHASLGATKALMLNNTNASDTSQKYWNNTEPTSAVFSIMQTGVAWWDLSSTQVAYCFAEIPGYSKFGSYTGNGSADGPFVHCGFRPRYVLVKCSSTTGNWELIDTARNDYNVSDAELIANGSAAEATLTMLDITANGFKLRTTDADFNSAQTYIFAAFAEHPFGGSNVSPSPAR